MHRSAEVAGQTGLFVAVRLAGELVPRVGVDRGQALREHRTPRPLVGGLALSKCQYVLRVNLYELAQSRFSPPPAAPGAAERLPREMCSILRPG